MQEGLLLIRVVVGVTMAVHGAQKLFGWFGGYGISGTGGWLESLGFRHGRLQAVASGSSELGGGLLLALGLFSPLGSAAIAGVMLVAVITVHLNNGFFNGSGGYEYNLVLATVGLAIAFTGPGSLSLDGAFGWNFAGPAWGLGAIGAAIIVGSSVLASRTAPVAAPLENREEEAVAA